MATKPNEGHLTWINDDDGAKYAAPSSAKRLQGWLANEKPPFQYFNWAWRLIDRWLQWAEAQSDENIAAIAAEQTGRTDADNALQDNIDAEAASRAGADNALQSDIDAEAVARAGADNTLQTNIDAHSQRTDNPHLVTKAQLGLGDVPNIDFSAVINGLTSPFESAASDNSTGYASSTGSTDVLTLTSSVKAGDVGILTAEFQSSRTGAGTSSFGIGIIVAASGVRLAGLDAGSSWGLLSNNQQSLYGNGQHTHDVTLPFVVSSTHSARVFTLRRRIALLPGGGSVSSQYHRMSIKWIYKQ